MRRVILTIVGILVLVAGLGLVALGISGIVLFGSDGTFESNTGRVTSLGYALASDTIEVEDVGPASFGPASLLVTAENRDAARPVFIGIARKADADRYLNGVAHDVVTDFDPRPFSVELQAVAGTVVPPPPESQPVIWDVTAVGTGQQVLEWDVAKGAFVVVVMNGDATAPVDVNLSVGAELPWVFPVSVITIVVGAVLAFIGITVLSNAGKATKKPTVVVPPMAPLPTPMGGNAGPTP